MNAFLQQKAFRDVLTFMVDGFSSLPRPSVDVGVQQPQNMDPLNRLFYVWGGPRSGKTLLATAAKQWAQSNGLCVDFGFDSNSRVPRNFVDDYPKDLLTPAFRGNHVLEIVSSKCVFLARAIEYLRFNPSAHIVVLCPQPPPLVLPRVAHFAEPTESERPSNYDSTLLEQLANHLNSMKPNSTLVRLSLNCVSKRSPKSLEQLPPELLPAKVAHRPTYFLSDINKHLLVVERTYQELLDSENEQVVLSFAFVSGERKHYLLLGEHFL